MRRAAQLAVCVAALVSANAVLADDGPEILVLAPGGAIDVDEARVLDARALDAAARPDLARALEREVPGLTLAETTGNSWQAAIGWRGFSASALQGAEQGLAVYLDGVRFNQPFGDTVLLDLVPETALARAQLMEASPVHGRNALAGSLLLQTRDGLSLSGLRGEADVDTVGSTGGSVSLGLGDEGANALVVAEVRDDKGWREASPSRLYRLFAKGLYAREGWGVDLSTILADTRLTGNGVAPVDLLAADYDAVFTRPDTTRARFARFIVAPHVDIGATGRIELRAHYQRLTRRSANGDLADFGPCDADPGFLCLGEDDAGFDEALLASGRRVAADPAIDDYAVFNRGAERTRSGGATLQWLDETRTDKGLRRLALGVAWERARTRFRATSELGELGGGRAVEGLGVVLTSQDGGITPIDVVSRMSDLAVFASAELPVTKALSVEAGGRWARNRVRLDDQLGVALDGTHGFSKINPSLEFDYALGRDVQATAGFALTSRIPTPAELSCADPEAPCTLANFFVADPPLKAVTAQNWHAGMQGESGGIAWRLSAWRSDTRNDIRMVASQVRGRAYFANLGRSRRQGVEASLDWRSDPWRVSVHYAFTDARFRRAFVISSPANPQADGNGLVQVARGDRLPGVPRHALDVFAGRSSDRWELGVAMRVRSPQVLLGDEGNDNAAVPGYAVFDVLGRVPLAPGIELSGELRNVFDKRYATAGTFAEIDDVHLVEAPDAGNPRAYAPGVPRRFTVSLRARF
ncbi:TonB-dependent receptor [Novosphingobium mangrovi (ex Huang et al. 2023)]|uniref:TonB-dependent receptor n=1 Tax=Novosphingobium mangrovi (ex Huang et al. 2023) TaxID=2976432 RepID=A0ABT2I1T1_9SPHN|nr:TonB-dependent receptor [Novosphingobium mangrovi (ex Huang et al. 2023)]MCT2398759.1 TonB-dependent receptor [Novosphingobium mangrovi (ex Huang et al. 2023)]